MKDFRGVKLSVGDTVAFLTRTTGKCATTFKEGTVCGFTPRRVKVSHERTNYRKEVARVVCLVPSKYCVKL